MHSVGELVIEFHERVDWLQFQRPFHDCKLLNVDQQPHALRFKKVENVTAVIWKMLMIAEKHFRKVKHPELMKGVYEGVQYVDGIEAEKEAAA